MGEKKLIEVERVIKEDNMKAKYINDDLINSKISKEVNKLIKNIYKFSKEEIEDIMNLTEIKLDHLLEQNISHELLIETNHSQVINKIVNSPCIINTTQNSNKNNLKIKKRSLIINGFKNMSPHSRIITLEKYK